MVWEDGGREPPSYPICRILNKKTYSRVRLSELREKTDGDLVLAALRGQTQAFGILVERYMRPGYLVALSVTGNSEDAEDVSQEAFLVALKRLEDCRDPERFGGWFLTIVRNRAKNLLRRERLRRGDELMPEILPGRGGPAEDLNQLEIREQLTKGLEGLSEVRREVLLFHDLEGWKHREIGERLGIPDGTVRSHLHFARKHLRGRLGGFHGSAPAGGES